MGAGVREVFYYYFDARVRVYYRFGRVCEGLTVDLEQKAGCWLTARSAVEAWTARLHAARPRLWPMRRIAIQRCVCVRARVRVVVVGWGGFPNNEHHICSVREKTAILRTRTKNIVSSSLNIINGPCVKLLQHASICILLF